MAKKSEGSSAIKAINKACVHKICSGQVVLSLSTAVKELVENSLDADATIVEVKLREYGSELLEVVDNGNGVKEEDFESLTLKHHTSKLEDFSDLSSVDTFGFRGEALSSLCALSNLVVVTCHKDADIGTKLEYDHNGVLIKASPSPRQVGTTVSLKNLFSTLPVRHKEFLRNLRREFGKMVHLLTAYCLVCTNKRITCVNQIEKGKKMTVLSTQASNSVIENLSCVFGAKQANNLLQVTQAIPSLSVLEEFYISGTGQDTSNAFRIEGYVSSCCHGEGRSSADRQYFFINGRPCDLPKVAKVVNEVYHMFNKHQYPFIFLNVCLEKDAIDINVTPDKRQIFFQQEKLLFATVKSSLLLIYEHKPSILECHPLGMVIENKNPGLMVSQFANTSPSQDGKSLSFSNLKRSFPAESDTVTCISQDCKNPRLSYHQTKESSLDGSEDLGVEKELCETSIENETISKEAFSIKTPPVSNCEETAIIDSQGSKQVILQRHGYENNKSDTKHIDFSTEKSSVFLSIASQPFNKKLKDPSNDDVCFTLTRPFRDDKVVNKVMKRDPYSSRTNVFQNILKFSRSTPQNSTLKIMNNLVQDNKASSLEQSNNSVKDCFQSEPASCDIINEIVAGISTSSKSIPDVGESNQASDILPEECEHKVEHIVESPLIPLKSTSDIKNEISVDEPVTSSRKAKYCTFSMNFIKQKLQSRAKSRLENPVAHRKFRSKIAASDNQNAEDELRKEISKDMFSQMEIIGQFNLGFIITKLKDDLFIIDQHATDEKYNFEILQKDTTLETQKLLQPQTLELTAVTESILLDNIHIFEKNGFKFNILDDDKPGQRVQLVSVPVSRNWSFGKEDIDELIFMLTDNPGRMCRPSRVSQMFASRSCRKSVMVGTPLSIPDMKKLVCHMGQIEQPWNCPHGRPTIRHLFSMNVLPSS